MERHDNDTGAVELGVASEETRGGTLAGVEQGGLGRIPTGIDADD